MLRHCHGNLAACLLYLNGYNLTQKRKVLYWEGSSKKDFKVFPIDVQKDMGLALFIVQLGGTPEPSPGRDLAPGCTSWWKTTAVTPSAQFTQCELATQCMCSMRSRRSPSPESLRRVQTWS